MTMYLRGMNPDLVSDPGMTGTVHDQPSNSPTTLFDATFACNTATLAVGANTGGSVTADGAGQFAFYTEDYDGPLWLLADARWWYIDGSSVDEILAAQLAPLVVRITALEATVPEVVTELPAPGDDDPGRLYLLVSE